MIFTQCIYKLAQKYASQIISHKYLDNNVHISLLLTFVLKRIYSVTNPNLKRIYLSYISYFILGIIIMFIDL